MADSVTHPDVESQKRRSTRIVQAVPLTVTGVDALGRPFQERTSTLIINCHGCRYQSKHYVLKNMWVYLEVPHNEAGRPPRSVRGRVTWIQRPRTVRELFQIGVELEVPGNVWGIAFPQADWFPFPESAQSSEIPSPAHVTQEAISAPEWVPLGEPPKSSEPEEEVEDNVRVLPLPGGADAPPQVARQVARIMAEVRQQLQTTMQESASQAVAAETRPLLASLERQLKDAAEKSVEAAVSTHVARMQNEALERMRRERDASVSEMRAEWSRELDRRITEARQQIDSQLAEVENARRANFEEQIQSQLLAAIEKLQAVSGSLGANASEVRTTIEQIRQASEEAAASEVRRWQELMNERQAEAQTRLANLEETAKRLGDQITGTTSIAESGWRGLLEADLAAANMRWNQSMETSLETAARQAAERLARNAESSMRTLEEQLQQRVAVVGSAFSQATNEAEGSLSNLRASVGHETAKAQEILSQLHEFSVQIDTRRNEFSTVVQASSDELARRGEALIEARSEEMNRRAESAVAGMAERLQPVLEAAGQDAIGRLASELEQRLSPQLARAAEIMNKLAFDQEQAEKAMVDHRNLLWQASEHSVQESVARAKELLAQVEKDFAESYHVAGAKWASELDSKATEITHTTFEALFKSADWYEKKVQTQMQSTLEKGLEQASESLRQKAGEMSGLFASELDHYSRSYVEHAHQQIEEQARETSEIAGTRMAQAGDTAAAHFTERAQQLAREQFELLSGRASSVFEQSAARIEAHSVQVSSKLEGDVRSLAAEFQRVLSQQAQQELAKGQQDMAFQVDLAKDNLRIETETLERQMRTSLQSLGEQAMDEYKQRLENASNSWLLTTVTKLNQQSEGLIDRLSASTEQRLRSTCGAVFAEMGETLRQRLAGLSAPLPAPAKPAPISVPDQAPENKPEEQT